MEQGSARHVTAEEHSQLQAPGMTGHVPSLLTEIAAKVENPTTAKTIMFWTYRLRPDNSPRSQLLKARLEHTWEFRRCGRTGRPSMQGHVVDRFEYLPGFRPEDRASYDPHLDSRWGTRHE